MSIDTKYIDEHFKALSVQYNDGRVKQAGRERARKVIIKEKSYADSNTSTCNLPASEKEELAASNLNLSEVKSIVGQQFYNPQVIGAMSCSLDMIFHPLPHGHGSITSNAQMKRSVKNMRRIGDDSASGYAISGSADNADNAFVVKVPRDPSATHSLFHEYYVAANGTNKMKTYRVPNFSSVYALVECGKPQIDPITKEVVQWCSPSDNEKVPYVLYENIYPSVTMGEYLKTASLQEFLSCLAQLTRSLIIAEKEIGYTHYDAHTENLLCLDVTSAGVGKFFQIPYHIGDRIEYIGSNRVLTFIDYGMSVVSVDGKVTDTPESSPELYGRYSGITFPMHDVYKFLLFSALDVSESKNPNSGVLLENMGRIFTFWNTTENILDVVKSQWDRRYSLPYTPETRVLNLEAFILHMSKVCDMSSIVSTVHNPNVKVLECSPCYSLEGVLKKAGVSRTFNVPQTFEKFFSVANYLSSAHRKVYEQIKSKFPYTEARRIYVEKLDKRFLSLEELGKSISVNLIISRQVLTEDGLASVQSYHYKLFKFLERLELGKNEIEVGTWVAIQYKDSALIQQLKDYESRQVKLSRRACELSMLAAQNYEVIRLATRQISKSSRRYQWYKSSAPDILRLQNKFCDGDLSEPIFSDGKIYLDSSPIHSKSEKYSGLAISTPWEIEPRKLRRRRSRVFDTNLVDEQFDKMYDI